MNYLTVRKNRNILQQLLKNMGCSSLREFSLKFKIPELQLLRLIHGLLGKMPLETAVKIAEGLNMSLNELIALFSAQDLVVAISENQSMVKDYQNLLQKYQIQEQELVQQFQLSTLEILESLLLQLPTVTAAVNQNPELPALTLLPLLKPIQELLETWGIKAIASVGDKIPYNPSEHELMEGTAKPGDLVEVRYLGYCQGDKLLYRAKVSAN